MTAENTQQVVFIDSRVPDIQDLLTGLQPDEQAFVIDASNDGIGQIADILAANNLTNLTSISIVSHGEIGELELGSSFITDGTLAGHSNALAEIGTALAPGGNIQLYGCDVAQGPAGQQFINDFSTYAGGVTVEAATHLVGSSGGWTLDAMSQAPAAGAPQSTSAAATATVPFTAAALTNFQGTLGLASDPQLWIAAGFSPDEIVRVDDVGGTATNATTLYAGNTTIQNIEGVVLDPTNQAYFVLHQNPDGSEQILEGSLVQALNNPSAAPTFTTIFTDTSFGNITQIALDSVSHQIYFTDNFLAATSSQETDTFQRVNYDGTGLTTLATIATGQNAGAVGFALDLNQHIAVFGVNVGGLIGFNPSSSVPPTSFLYEATGVSSAATSVAITQLPLGNSGTFTLDPSLGFFTQDGGLAIDPATHKLYFTLENGPTGGGLFEYDLTGNSTGQINTVWQQTAAGPTGAPVELAIDPTTGEYFIGFDGGTSATSDQFNGLWRGLLTSTAAPTSFLAFPDDGSVQPFEFALDQQPTLSITPTNPTFTESTLNPAATNNTPVGLVSTATVTDPDNSAVVSATVSVGSFFVGDVLSAATTGTSITQSYNSTTGVLTLTGADTIADYQAVLASVTFTSTSDNPTDFGSDASRTLTFQINDGLLTSTTQTVAVTVVGVDDPPTLAGTGNASFTENGPAVTLSGSASVSDPDNLTLAGATVAITGGTFAGDGDVLGVNTTGTSITASYNATTETLLLSGSDTLAHYQQVLDSVTFVTASDNPGDFGSAPTRTVTWTLNDGGATASVTTTVSITAVNDPPTLAGTANASFTENGAQVTLSGAASVTDPDNVNLASATVAITGGAFPGDGDVLSANIAGTAITASYNAATETLVLAGADTLAHYQQVLDSVTFVTASDNPTDFGADPTRTITWQLNDGSASNNLSAVSTTTVSITAVNDPPTLSGTADASFTENGPAATLSGAAAVSDPDGTSLVSATVAVTGGAFPGDGDVLGANTAGTAITASYNAATETLVLVGTDTLAHYQQVLDSVTFGTASDNPTDFGADPTRTVTWQLDDGSASNNLSAVSTTTVSITAVNDAPMLAGTTNASFTENGAQVTLSGAASVSDVDSLNLAGATVAITGGAFPGDGDVLSANIAGTAITSSYNAATETLVLAGTDTLAHYQQVLDSVTFVTASDNPDDFGSAPTRTVTWTLNDGGATNATTSVTTAVSITAVNDAPTLAGTANASYTENGSPVTLSGAASVSDPDNLSLAGATVAITGGTFAGDGDVLGVNVAGTSITASYNAATETLVLAGSDSLAHYQQVLDSVAFVSTSDNPTDFGADPTRTVTWQLNDGSASSNLSAVSTTTVSITAVNDAPTLSNVAASASYTEQAAATTVSGSLTVSDPDSLTLANATVRITGGTFAGDGDVLAANVSGTSITASYNAATETLTLSGIDTVAHYQSVLDSVTFFDPSDNPTNYGSNPTRTLTWVVTDGSAASAVATETLNVTAVNDAPTLTGVPSTASFRSGQTVTLAPAASVSDPDNLTLANATVRVTGGTFAGDSDVLAANVSGTAVTASYNAATETLTLTGSDTLAHYQQVLDSVTFTTGANPTNFGLDPTRTLSWTVNDGSGSNNTASATETISISNTLVKNDFNGDGKSDIVFTDNSGGLAPLQYLMDGTTVTAQATLPNPGAGWHIVGSGDFNSDGRADILWQNANGTPMIWTMNGSTVTSMTTLANPGSAWQAVGTGDFNGDAQSDIVFQNNNGTPMIWTMNGTSVASTASLSNPGATWDLIGTGDFNGDGKSDLVFQQPNGTPMIWEMNGTSVIATATLPKPHGAGSWQLVGTGDFNGDGDADLLFQKSNGTPMIWEMNGTSVTATATLANPGATWKAIGTGDYNGDGKSDILFLNNDGTPQIWTMNGTSVIATATLPNPGSSLHANTG